MCIRDSINAEYGSPDRVNMEFQHLFDQIDTDGNGCITQAEFQKAVTGAQKHCIEKTFEEHGVSWKAVFQKVGLELFRNGTLSAHEFGQILEQCAAGMSPRRPAGGSLGLEDGLVQLEAVGLEIGDEVSVPEGCGLMKVGDGLYRVMASDRSH
eukprot:TRINITY_DN10481_c0_g1_i6.p1 TRINITY_DN10481_c0_g1~~TRINITY_DN10481_c0_g1_i6.p1  ORF type:complete len:153 (+),score=49.41 TRINITY_DN10481_c0_g1_i6:99-557(+)